MSRPHLIIVGYAGSGKTTLAHSVAAEIGACAVELGRFVVAEAKRLNSGITPLEHADNIFRAGDYRRFVNYALNEIQNHHGVCVVVGPRLTQEVNYLRVCLHEAICIGLDVPATIREQRRSKQLIDNFCTQQENEQFIDQFKHRDDVEQSWGLDRTILESDHILNGAPSMASLVQRVVAIWKERQS